ncbi:phage tail protein [Asticcacaulis solisilvae]|uniref:phage tail protein n=1 Tax=Asticcacaulis solisilvae TaxID=1217274 RepID=UPI003FD7A5DB
MEKPDSLRAFLVARAPELKRNPEKLQMYVKGGSTAARWSPDRFNYEYRYTLHVQILGFTGHPDQIFLPVLVWLTDNEKAALQNFDNGDQAVTFDVDLLDDKTVDLELQIKLTEAVDVVQQPGGTFRLTHRPEPPAIGFDLVENVPVGTKISAVYTPDNELIYQAPEA